ncbi:hypothetical protein ACHAQJ_005692 [Trichoderma viride]
MSVPAIAILGGGPSGLALARLLECNKIDYVVYERDESPSVEGRGGSLDIHGKTGQLVLKEAGLFEEFNKYARWDATKTLVQDKNGTTHLVFGEDQDAPEIDRASLRKILIESIPPSKIRWGHVVKSVEKLDSGEIAINFGDGSSLTSAKPLYSGKQYLEGKISTSNPFYPTIHEKVGQGNLMAMGEGKQISAQQQGDGSYRIYVGLTVPEDFATSGAVDLSKADGDAARSHFITNADFFGTWGSELKDIVANSQGALKPWPLYHLPSDALCWGRVPGITLIGDAAHVSTPFVGEGVNCSMYDSLSLAGQIVERGLEQLDAAVEAYEKDMFQRGKDLIERSNASAALIFAQDGPKPLLDVIAQK